MGRRTARGATVGWFAGASKNIERMTEHTKAQQDKIKLPCQWVEEEGFDVDPVSQPATDRQTLSDTAFLLKSKPVQPPLHSPAP